MNKIALGTVRFVFIDFAFLLLLKDFSPLPPLTIDAVRVEFLGIFQCLRWLVIRYCISALGAWGIGSARMATVLLHQLVHLPLLGCGWSASMGGN